MAVYNSSYGHPKRAIRYTNVYCRGHEEELGDCTHHTLEFEAGRTYKAEVAGVDCGGNFKCILKLINVSRDQFSFIRDYRVILIGQFNCLLFLFVSYYF